MKNKESFYKFEIISVVVVSFVFTILMLLDPNNKKRETEKVNNAEYERQLRDQMEKDLYYFSKKLDFYCGLDSINKQKLDDFIKNNDTNLSFNVNSKIDINLTYNPNDYYNMYTIEYIIK